MCEECYFHLPSYLLVSSSGFRRVSRFSDNVLLDLPGLFAPCMRALQQEPALKLQICRFAGSTYIETSHIKVLLKLSEVGATIPVRDMKGFRIRNFSL